MLKESAPFPFYLAAIISVYCFIGGVFYVFIKIPQGKIYFWSDWVFYIQVYLTIWAVLPLYSGIHQNYTLGIEKLSHHALKISNKSLYVVLVMMVWKYFDLDDSRIIFWWLIFSVHFVFLRFLIHLHQLVFHFLTRVPSRTKIIMGSIFFLAYFGAVVLSGKHKLEILFHYQRLGLVFLAVILQKPMLLNFCEKLDATVMNYDTDAGNSGDRTTNNS